jgi:hypothetical protein
MECTCGRHLCKPPIFRPNLDIHSIYRNDFKNKTPYGNIDFRN